MCILSIPYHLLQISNPVPPSAPFPFLRRPQKGRRRGNHNHVPTAWTVFNRYVWHSNRPHSPQRPHHAPDVTPRERINRVCREETALYFSNLLCSEIVCLCWDFRMRIRGEKVYTFLFSGAFCYKCRCSVNYFTYTDSQGGLKISGRG